VSHEGGFFTFSEIHEFFLSNLIPDKSVSKSLLSGLAVMDDVIALDLESVKSFEELFSVIIDEVLVTELIINFIIIEILFKLLLGAFEL